jgi:alkanesulfonate monooxygenase SsuD/methylene tetrahydromethanopterin reductase-like flavin-dependent oxidoreductase (luciferase family)
MLFGLNFPLSGIFSDIAAVADLAQEAEASGWDGCFVWDHLSIVAAERLADPWLALALIAHATERIRLGPLVTPLFRRHTGKLAYETVTLDHLSKGRLILGAGLGSDVFREISAFGGPLDDKIRAQMLDEGLAILMGLWSGQPFSFVGKHYHLEHAQVIPPCLQSPRIPIWIAASGQRRSPLRRAAQYDGVVPVSGDLSSSLRPAQVRDMVSYIQRFRSREDPFDVVHFGQAAGLRPDQARAVIDSYGEVGVTWWIETMPFEAQPFELIRERVRRGPPFRGF